MDVAESLAHTKWVCKYHIVFIPKFRRKTARLNQADECFHLMQRDVPETVLTHKRVNTIIGADTQRENGDLRGPKTPWRRARLGLRHYATRAFPQAWPRISCLILVVIFPCERYNDIR